MTTEKIKPFVDRKTLVHELRNGFKEAKPLVALTIGLMKELLDEFPIVYCDFVRLIAKGGAS